MAFVLGYTHRYKYYNYFKSSKLEYAILASRAPVKIIIM